MAGRNIKGITVEIGGDTSGLQKALSDVNGKIKSTQAQLKDVDRLLKLDPTNTVLVAQKQELLRNAIAETGEKLESLEAAQEDVNAAMEAGRIGREQYMAFQREVEETRAAMNRYKAELDGMDAAQEQLVANVSRLNRLFELTGTSVDDYADVLGSRLVAAIKNGSASSDQLRTAIERVGRSAVGGRADINQLNEALDAVDDGQALRNLQHELEETGNQADSTTGNLESMGQTLTGGVLMEAADQLSVVGDKIAEVGEKASAYFGETGEAAEQTAGIIKDVYAEGVGDSMDAVSDAVITVKKNIKDLDETELTHLTEQAITLDELYGIDMNETLRGVNALMQQYGMAAQEAMDYIVKGTQNGLDKTNELGDNLSEYSGKFAQAGYSAQEYFQLLQNGLEGGAYNLDKVNDAINEVTTRLADGTIADSMSQINEKTGKLEAGTGGWGQEVEDVFRQWQQGGATQKQVIDAIVADIQNTESQQDKLNKAALAFGTMGEDGNTKFIESLTSVGNAYDEVSGSAEGMFDSSTTESQKFEASLRLLKQSLIPLGESIMSLANEIIPPLAKGIQAVGEFFGNLPGPVQNFVVILGTLITAFTALAPVIAAIVTVVTTLGTATLGPIIGIIAGVAAAITAIIAIIKNWGAVTEWLGELWAGIKEKCSDIWGSVCAFFTETIPAAWDSLVAKFEGIPAWWSGIWQQVGDFFNGIWSGICGFFTETIPAAWQSVVAWFQGIPAWWSGIWQQVHDFFINIWNTISQNPVISGIVTTITALWNNAVTTLQSIWENIKTIAAAAWELIKNIILGPVLLLIDLVTGDFEQLKEDAQNIWENIKNAALTIWTALKDLVSNVVKGWIEHTVILVTGLKDTLHNIWEMIKQAAVQAWENLKNSVIQAAQNLKESVIQAVTNLKTSIAQAWENIKSTASQTWENIKSFVVKTAQNLKESAIQAFRNMVDGIWNTLSNLGTVVSNGFQSAINFITSLPGKAFQWGADFINGIARGISNAIGNVTSAVSDVADKIRSFLHFSVPDEGPLTEYESWMPDFMKGLAKGIEKSKSLVTNAIAGVSKDMTINANAMVEQSGAAQNSAIMNIATILSRYLPYLEQGSMIVLDTGTLVGETAPAMSRRLGEIEIEESRL